MANILKRWLAIRKIRCPGDHVVYVYRDPRDAIPIFVEGIQAQAKASATLAASTTAQLSGKYQEQITGITKLVAQETEKLLTRFLVIYETYSSSPCRHEKWLLEKIDELRLLAVWCGWGTRRWAVRREPGSTGMELHHALAQR
jgi:hypothetical protein